MLFLLRTKLDIYVFISVLDTQISKDNFSSGAQSQTTGKPNMNTEHYTVIINIQHNVQSSPCIMFP